MIRIALDAMGGDNAPGVPVDGAVLAQRELSDQCEILLVGRRGEVEAALSRHSSIPTGISVVDAPEVVTMGDKPLFSVRKKPNSSIAVGLKMHKEGQADAFLSAGNTGAVMATSVLTLGLHPGVERPAIASPLPTDIDPIIVIDSGANVDCSPRELEGFARLGTVYARDILGYDMPRVGLLNIGEEAEKGGAAAKEAYALLMGSTEFEFVGNIEGRGVLHDKCDVVVCDGFVGNVVLKLMESAADFFITVLRRELDKETMESGEMTRAIATLDWATYGGAPLLGVRGISIICHGSSSPLAIKNAIKVAVQSVVKGLSDHIGATFSQTRAEA